MNGRIYDPSIGKFLQADPFIDGATTTAGYNRYSYVRNNPLNATDPSGHFGVFAAAVIGAVAGYAGSELDIPVLTAVGGMALCGTGVGCAAGFAFGATMGGGGSFEDALQNAAFAGVSAMAFSAIGATDWKLPAKAFAHGITGGVMTELQGGKFGHGFVSAGITKLLNINGLVGTDPQLAPVRVALAAIIGGTISEATGGKFANGAITAAFGQAFNGESEVKRVNAAQSQWVTRKRIDVDRSSPVGKPRTVTLDVDQTRSTEGPFDTLGRLVGVPEIPSGGRSKLWSFVTSVNQWIANQVGSGTYVTETRVMQDYQKYNARLTIWSENISTGEIRGVGQRAIVHELPSPPYTRSETYLEESRWFYE